MPPKKKSAYSVPKLKDFSTSAIAMPRRSCCLRLNRSRERLTPKTL